MLYVKIMSAQDMPDTDPNKHYTIVPVERNEVMQFVDNPEHVCHMSDTGHPYVEMQDRPKGQNRPMHSAYQLLVYSPDGGHESHDLTGNAYVMTENGKTIASHGA